VYLFFARIGLADSYLGLILAHAALGAPFVVTTVLATLQGFNHNLVRASLSLGASPLRTFFRITLPVIAPGLISGALFAFATSFDEVVLTLFVAGPEQATLPRQMFAGIKDNISPTIAALATILILFRPACCWPWNGCAGATRRPRASEPRLPLRRTDMLQQLKDPSLLRQQPTSTASGAMPTKAPRWSAQSRQRQPAGPCP
jgi:ABC-type spermidine/putrescine transport system permease subunit II